jgi:hypothetical protein
MSGIWAPATRRVSGASAGGRSWSGTLPLGAATRVDAAAAGCRLEATRLAIDGSRGGWGTTEARDGGT